MARSTTPRKAPGSNYKVLTEGSNSEVPSAPTSTGWQNLRVPRTKKSESLFQRVPNTVKISEKSQVRICAGDPGGLPNSKQTFQVSEDSKGFQLQKKGLALFFLQ